MSWIEKKDVNILGRPDVPTQGVYLDGRPLIPCCIHVRCKSLYFSGVERPGLLHDSGTITYWCNLTQESIGCDDADVSPRLCQAGRSCCNKA